MPVPCLGTNCRGVAACEKQGKSTRSLIANSYYLLYQDGGCEAQDAIHHIRRAPRLHTTDDSKLQPTRCTKLRVTKLRARVELEALDQVPASQTIA